jgi:hypothetical protein
VVNSDLPDLQSENQQCEDSAECVGERRQWHGFAQEPAALRLPVVRNACRKMLQILTVSSNVAASRHYPPALTNGATSKARLTANVGTPASQSANAISCPRRQGISC